MGDLAALDVSAGFDDLKPPHVAQGLPRARHGLVDRVLDGRGGGAHQFGGLVNMVAHASLPVRNEFTAGCTSSRHRRRTAPPARESERSFLCSCLFLSLK